MILVDTSGLLSALDPRQTHHVAAAVTIIDRYADLSLGLADAALVVLAERYGYYDLLTLDQRHFRAVTGPNGRPFRLLPYDSV